MRAKGHDWRVSIKVDGREVKALRSFNSVEVNFGLGVETFNYVGERAPRVNGINNEVTFGCPFDVDSKDYLDLIDAQRQKNAPNAERKNLRIDVTASVDFGDGGRARVQFNDCTLHDATLSVSGRVDGNTTSSPTFTAGTWQKLA